VKPPHPCRVCHRELRRPTLSAIRHAEMFGWYFPSRCQECHHLAPRRIAGADRGPDEAGGRSEESKQQRD